MLLDSFEQAAKDILDHLGVLSFSARDYIHVTRKMTFQIVRIMIFNRLYTRGAGFL